MTPKPYASALGRSQAAVPAHEPENREDHTNPLELFSPEPAPGLVTFPPEPAYHNASVSPEPEPDNLAASPEPPTAGIADAEADTPADLTSSAPLPPLPFLLALPANVSSPTEFEERLRSLDELIAPLRPQTRSSPLPSTVPASVHPPAEIEEIEERPRSLDEFSASTGPTVPEFSAFLGSTVPSFQDPELHSAELVAESIDLHGLDPHPLAPEPPSWRRGAFIALALIVVAALGGYVVTSSARRMLGMETFPADTRSADSQEPIAEPRAPTAPTSPETPRSTAEPDNRPTVQESLRPAPSDAIAPIDDERAPEIAGQTTLGSPATVSASGILIVESHPTGANVYLDGQLAGKTPLVLSGIAAGEHSVHLELGAHFDWVSSVRILPGDRNRVTASLEEEGHGALAR